MTAPPAIPQVPLKHLKVRAKIDYVKAYCEVHFPDGAPRRSGVNWTHDQHHDYWVVTIHDPSVAEIRQTVTGLSDPPMYGFEIAVDFLPRAELSPPDRQSLLEQTFKALAARFRPDDESFAGAGFKAAFSDRRVRPTPFHERLANLDEVLVYGHRGEGQNSKLYFKTMDQKSPLPVTEHRVRLETTFNRFGCAEMGMRQLKDLLNGDLRFRFAKVFRIIDHPEIRHPGKRSPKELDRLTIMMHEAWNRAGVGAFDTLPLPTDSSVWAKEAAAYRLPDLLPLKDFRLRRDAATNKAIGDALHRLDKALLTTFPRA